MFLRFAAEYLKMKHEICQEEMDRIWGNTRTYMTADSEVAALCDLYDGLEKSGYVRETFQREDHLRHCTYFVVMDRPGMERAILTLIRHKNIDPSARTLYTRLNGIEYRNGSLGLHPSSAFNADDISSNPFLLALLLGELDKTEYFSGGVSVNEPENEIYLDMHKTYVKEYADNMGALDAFAYAADLAMKLEKLSSPGTRSSTGSGVSGSHFEYERLLCGNMGLSYEPPVICVSGKPLYEIGSIPRALIKKRRLEKRLCENLRPKEREGILFGIQKNQEDIDSGNPPHYPLFRIL